MWNCSFKVNSAVFGTLRSSWWTSGLSLLESGWRLKSSSDPFCDEVTNLCSTWAVTSQLSVSILTDIRRSEIFIFVLPLRFHSSPRAVPRLIHSSVNDLETLLFTESFKNKRLNTKCRKEQKVQRQGADHRWQFWAVPHAKGSVLLSWAPPLSPEHRAVLPLIMCGRLYSDKLI